MKNRILNSNRLMLPFIFLVVMIYGCKSDSVEPTVQDSGDNVIVEGEFPEDKQSASARLFDNHVVNWDNRAHDTYSYNEAVEDFGNLRGNWREDRCFNSNGRCRVTLLKNALSGAGGNIVNVDVPDGEEYEMEYDVMFHSQFDWSRGGKVGFGFHIGDGNTGGDPGWDGNGGTLRMMWYNNNGSVYLQPYVYYKDQSWQYGDDFGKRFYINKGTWYHVYMHVKSNTGSSTNGLCELKINGQTVLSMPIRWTTNDAKRLIREITFHTFRGGSQDYWMSPEDGYIYFDNLKWTKLDGGGNGGNFPRVEAENYFNMDGVETESCSEGGQNVGYIDASDWMAYSVNVPQAGNYTINYRVASANGGGTLQLESYGGGTVYGLVNIPDTGGWQNWTTVSHTVYLPAGQQNLAIKASSGGWNLNWWGN